MSTYICKRCHHPNKTKAHLISHLTRVNPCTPCEGCAKEDQDIDALLIELGEDPHKLRERIFQCPKCKAAKLPSARPCAGCQTIYKHQPTLSRHMKTCNGPKMTKMPKDPVTLHPFGEEDLDHLTLEFKTECLLALHEGIVKMCEKIYFDPQKPENNNVRFKNWKHNLFEIYSQKDWISMNQNTVLNNMIHHTTRVLADHFFTLMYDPAFVERQETLLKFQNEVLLGVQGVKASHGYSNMRHDVRILVVNQTAP